MMQQKEKLKRSPAAFAFLILGSSAAFTYGGDLGFPILIASIVALLWTLKTDGFFISPDKQ